MKFIKEDGTIEEGEPLEEYAASFLVNLEAYLHDRVCKNSYHANYEGTKRCHEAARFLTMIVTTIDKTEWGEVLDEKVNPKPKPAPAIEAAADTIGMDPMNYAESTPVAVATEKVDLPF